MVAAVAGTGELAGYILSGPARLEDCPLEIENTPESEESWDVPASAQAGTAETVYLHDISVRPEFRKFGLGRRLVATVEALAAELGVPTITLTAVAGAWDHWSRLGFVELARKSNAEVSKTSPDGLLSEAAVERLKSYPTEAVFMRRATQRTTSTDSAAPAAVAPAAPNDTAGAVGMPDTRQLSGGDRGRCPARRLAAVASRA